MSFISKPKVRFQGMRENALGLTTQQAIGHKIDNLSVTRIAGNSVDPINHLP